MSVTIKINNDQDFPILNSGEVDLDFTFNNHLSGVKIGVVYDLKITHKSPGPTNEDWENNRKQFVEIYKTK